MFTSKKKTVRILTAEGRKRAQKQTKLAIKKTSSIKKKTKTAR